MLFLQRTIKNVEMFYGSGQIFFPLGISNGSKNIGAVRVRICPSDDFIMPSTSHYSYSSGFLRKPQKFDEIS